MRYAELNVSYEEPKCWRYTSTMPKKPKRFQNIWLEQQKFEETKGKLKEDLTNTLCRPIDQCTSEEQVGVVLDPILERLSKSHFMADTVNEDLLLKKANKNTLQKKLQEWCRNLNNNVPIIKKSPGAHTYFGKFKNVPCVIVASGPSLANSIEQVKQLKGKALIMACGPSLRPLIKRGVIPDFMNAHDANGPDPKAGTGGGPKFFGGVDASGTVALFVNYVNPLTIQAYKGPICYYYVGDESLPVYRTMAMACDDEKRKDGSFLQSNVTGGSSVSHTALYLAMLFGCNPITYIGFDLSYPEMTQSHFESDNAKDISKMKLVDVETVGGRMVKTNLSFLSYKHVAERMAPVMSQYFGCSLFNSTEDKDGNPAGIVHQGLEPLSFKTFIEHYCKNEREELKHILEDYRNVSSL